MKILKAMIDTLAGTDFNAKRGESRKKRLAQITETLRVYYSRVFTKKKKVDYRALIHSPKLRANPDRNAGTASAAKTVVGGGKHEKVSERGEFNDLVEVKPYIKLLGDLYSQTRKM